jgi:RecA-family ATPase
LISRTLGITVTAFGDIEQTPTKKHLVRHFLGAGELSCAFGPPGCGKSVGITDLAAHIAWGQDWFGRRVTQGGVIFLAAERAALVKRRLAAFRLYYGLTDLPLKVFSGSIDLRTNRTQAEGIVNYVKRWKDEEDIDTQLIVGDTISKLLFGGDENSPKDMGAYINNVSHIQDGTGAHVLLVHHVPHRSTGCVVTD